MRLLVFRPSPDRWALATRIAVSTAILAALGWAAGNIGAGLIAVLGLLTADYGTDRPYANRAFQSATIAVALAAAVTLGAWASAYAWLAVTVVSMVAVVAVWLCSALGVGPPGAYMFVLVCAAGVGVSASQLRPWQIGLLVLGGGATAWAAQMSPALIDWRGPEKRALTSSGDAVATYLRAIGTPSAAKARRQAAEALSRAWEILVDHQGRHGRSADTVTKLRDANHALHRMFAEGLSAESEGRMAPDSAADSARAIGALEADPAVVIGKDRNRPPLPPIAVWDRLTGAVHRGSHVRRVMARVAVATPVAGALAGMFGVGHAYWAMAAAVLVLHQGAHLTATLRRGAERVVGTLAGLGFTALILTLHPQGWWLIAVIAGLQFCIEIFIVTSYALATVFITALALTISSGAHPVDVGTLILDRGADTLIGCGVGLAVYLVMSRRQEAGRIPAAIVGVLARATAVTELLAYTTPRSLDSREARRALQNSIFDLNAAQDAASRGTRRDRAAAARWAGAVGATESLGYATVAGCWAAEQYGAGISGRGDPEAYLALIRRLTDMTCALDHNGHTTAGEDLPPVSESEVRALVRAIDELDRGKD